MSRILRAGRRALARRASPPGTGEPQPKPAKGRVPLLAIRPGRAGAAALFIQDLAAAANAATGQNWPTPPATSSQRRAPTTHRLLPRTIQLCIHCRQSPAGFWVSRDSSQTARRPWCLSCCQHLDPARHHIQPFDS